MRYLSVCIFIFTFFACSKRQKTERQVPLNPDFDTAYLYLDEGKSDSSFFFFDKARLLFLEQGDSLGVAKCLINMAISQREQSDYYGAQETALQAIGYLDMQDTVHRIYLSTNYNNLATATDKLKEAERAISFYELAIKFSDDSLNNLIYKNNMALSYQHLKHYEEAAKIFTEILIKVKPNTVQYARFLSNKANVTWEADSTFSPVSHYLVALEIRQREDDLWGQNASYAQLADYYADYLPDSALYYTRKQYHIAQRIKSADAQVRALQRLVRFSSTSSVKNYFESYKALSDSLEEARSKSKNQFALIRYEVEKGKSDNLQLQKENTEKAYYLTRQRFWTGSLAIAVLLVIVGAIIWYKKRKQHLLLDNENKIKAEQLKLSRKVHDVVANGIYRVMSEIEYKKELDRDDVLDRLEDMYNKSRDISYEAEGAVLTKLGTTELVSSLLKSFSSSHCKVLIAGNETELWEHISEPMKKEVQAVLQELMVNMRKHSAATDVLIRFNISESVFELVYQDNGKGFLCGMQEGKGLRSTGNRIKTLHGTINFVSEVGKGLRVTILIPLS